MPQPLRTFIAIELSTDLRRQLGQVIAQLSRKAPPHSVKWVEAATIHLSLKFLGDIPEAGLAAIQEGLMRAALPIGPFSFSAQGLGCFPNLKQPRVIWAGIDPAGAKALRELAKSVEDQIAPLGYPTEARGYSPHLTLGRVRREAAPSEAAQVGETVRGHSSPTFGSETVAALSLMKSELQPGGPIYTPLFVVKLSES